jgi:hypothetical protein
MKLALIALAGTFVIQSNLHAQCMDVALPEVTDSTQTVDEIPGLGVSQKFFYDVANTGFFDETLSVTLRHLDGPAPGDWGYQFCDAEEFCRPIQPWETEFTIELLVPSDTSIEYDVEFLARSFDTGSVELTLLREFCPEEPIVVTHTFTLDDATGVEPRPIAITLAQPWPNPFNPVTHLPFRLAAAGDVSGYVTDLAGREVAQLSGGSYPAGDHELVFDASGLSSGVYLYHIQTADARISGRVTLQK